MPYSWGLPAGVQQGGVSLRRHIGLFQSQFDTNLLPSFHTFEHSTDFPEPTMKKPAQPNETFYSLFSILFAVIVVGLVVSAAVSWWNG